MTDDEALEEIKRLAARNYIRFSSHARKRMAERGATREDVKSALLTATSARFQNEHGTWAVDGGVDTDGDDLSVRCDIESDVVVITIY